MTDKRINRRQRGRREASFLESVRDTLHSLSVELADIKQCIQKLQPSELRELPNDIPWFCTWDGYYPSFVESDRNSLFDDACTFWNGEWEPCSNADSVLNLLAPEFRPMHGDDHDKHLHASTPKGILGDFRSISVAAWEVIHAPFAMSIDDTHSDDTADDAEIICKKCGGTFGPQYEKSYEGDACDKCGEFYHSSCLTEVVDIRGELSLCDECIRLYPQLIPSRRSEKACLPEEHGDRGFIGSSRSSSVPIDMPAPNLAATAELVNLSITRDEHDSQEDDLVQVFEPLDRTINYMLNFLEGHHAKSKSISSDVHSMVLRYAKTAMKWKETPRSNIEVEEYVKGLNKIMGEIVQRL